MTAQIKNLQHDVSDLEISSTAINLALGARRWGPKKADIAKGFGGVWRVNDGITDGRSGATGQIFKTKKIKNPWAMIILPKEKHITNVRLYPDFSEKQVLTDTESGLDAVTGEPIESFGPDAKKLMEDTRVYLTNINCKAGNGNAINCSQIWSQEAISSKDTFYCGQVDSDVFGEITGESNWDVGCNPNNYGEEKFFMRVLVVRQTAGTDMYRQGPWDGAAKEFGAPVKMTTGPATQELALAEIQVMAKETVSEAIADIEDQMKTMAHLESEISDLHAQSDTFNLALGARMLNQQRSTVTGGISGDLVNGKKINPDPLTDNPTNKNDQYTTKQSDMPYIIYDLNNNRKISHVRIYPNNLDDDVYSKLQVHQTIPNRLPKWWKPGNTLQKRGARDVFV
jgi:hypothetical protein